MSNHNKNPVSNVYIDIRTLKNIKFTVFILHNRYSFNDTRTHIQWALNNTAVKCLNKFEWEPVHDRYIFTIDRWTMCVLQKCMQSETFGFFKQILYSINFLYQLHKRDRRVRKNLHFQYNLLKTVTFHNIEQFYAYCRLPCHARIVSVNKLTPIILRWKKKLE